MTATAPQPVDFGQIPDELKAIPHWVDWRNEWSEERDETTKMPRQVSGRKASSTNRATWATFEDAKAAYLKGLESEHPYSGVGIVLTEELGIVGIDLDGCRTPEGAQPWARKVLGMLGPTYVEVSPSGTGLRAFVRGSIPEGARNRVSLEGHVDSVPGEKRAELEWYTEGRYLTLTGMRFEDTPRVIAEVSPEALAEVWNYVTALAGKQARKEKQASPENDLSPVALPDDELLGKARNAKDGARFTALYDDGDVSQHGDDYSAATMALLCLLAFWTRKDAERMDRLFRDSALMRPKWDEPRGDSTWGTLDIQKACEFQKDVYTEAEGKRQAAASARLLKLVDSSGATLCHDAEGRCYITVREGKTQQTYRLDSKETDDWLAHRFWKAEGRGLNTQARDEAKSVLAGKARWEGKERIVAVRVAEIDTDAGPVVYIDLGSDSWKVIEIKAGTWGEIPATACPVLFVRRAGSLPLPAPVDEGTEVFERFARLIGLSLIDPGFLLLVFCCLQALRGRGPYPILQATGEQGSGKSTAVEFVRKLIDPNTAALRSIPATDRNAFIACSNSHVQAFDNVSGMNAVTSDRLCRISSGGALAMRSNYTDDAETLFSVCCPILINGINSIAERADLAERCVTVRFRHISPDKRKYKSEMDAEFEEMRPALLGALLTGMASGLERLPTTMLKMRPRLADFARYCVASEEALGFEAGSFFDAFDGSRRELIESTIEGDEVAELIVALLKNGAFEGTASKLYEELEKQAGYGADKKSPRSWPKSASALKRRFNRLAPSLREVGIAIEESQDVETRTKVIHMEDTGEYGGADLTKQNAVQAAQATQDEENKPTQFANGASSANGIPNGSKDANGIEIVKPLVRNSPEGAKKGDTNGPNGPNGISESGIGDNGSEPSGDGSASASVESVDPWDSAPTSGVEGDDG